MSTRTRRLVFLAALVTALAIPAESILLKALVTPSAQDAIRDWVEGLDSTALATTTANVQSYPFAYRREILRRQSPTVRSNVWRHHLSAYVQARPGLDPAVVAMIKTASDLASPSFFDLPTDAERASVHAVADQLTTAIGREETEYLLYRLGGRDGTFASFEPLALFLGNKVRGFVQLSAIDPPCECSMAWGCYDVTVCSQAITCNWDNRWPMCGWLWSDPCDGLCLYQ